ncbi:SRPBCC domain-containing protein [Paenibacillus sp. SI8]|uniref:SRPBCC domain-containing protein n=1 Tax=unclassified Paenibacillus TaxID=185978 RepID=UPI0034655F32
MPGTNPVGLTASVGYQIGVRRSLPLSQEQVWHVLTSSQGRRLWLGVLEEMNFTAGYSYRTDEGTSGEIRVVKPLEQLRMTWQPQNWPNPSTLQIRLIPAKSGKTTISFHQEKLDDERQRAAMKLRWEEAITAISNLIANESNDDK